MKTVTSLNVELAPVISILRSVKTFRLSRESGPRVGREFGLIPMRYGVLTVALAPEVSHTYPVANGRFSGDVMLRLRSVQDRFDLLADLQTWYVRHRDSLLEVANRDYRR